MLPIKNFTCLILCFTLVACGSMGTGSKMEKQQDILTMKDSV
jgi:hypothetical protein